MREKLNEGAHASKGGASSSSLFFSLPLDVVDLCKLCPRRGLPAARLRESGPRVPLARGFSIFEESRKKKTHADDADDDAPPPPKKKPPTHAKTRNKNSDARPLHPPAGAPPPAVRPLADLLSDYVSLKEAAAARVTLAREHPALREVLQAINGAAAVSAEAELRALRRAGDERRALREQREAEEAEEEGRHRRRVERLRERRRQEEALERELHESSGDRRRSFGSGKGGLSQVAAAALPPGMRSPPRRALRKRPPARRFDANAANNAAFTGEENGGFEGFGVVQQQHNQSRSRNHHNNVDLLDMPLSHDALLSLVQDDDATERLAESLAPRLAAIVDDPGFSFGSGGGASLGGGGRSGGGGAHGRSSGAFPSSSPAFRQHNQQGQQQTFQQQQQQHDWAAQLASDPAILQLLQPLVSGGGGVGVGVGVGGGAAAATANRGASAAAASMPPPPPRPPAAAAARPAAAAASHDAYAANTPVSQNPLLLQPNGGGGGNTNSRKRREGEEGEEREEASAAAAAKKGASPKVLPLPVPKKKQGTAAATAPAPAPAPAPPKASKVDEGQLDDFLDGLSYD